MKKSCITNLRIILTYHRILLINRKCGSPSKLLDPKQALVYRNIIEHKNKCPFLVWLEFIRCNCVAFQHFTENLADNFDGIFFMFTTLQRFQICVIKNAITTSYFLLPLRTFVMKPQKWVVKWFWNKNQAFGAEF